MSTNKHLNASWWALRLALGLAALLAGLDKFFNLLANWEMYLSPLAARLLGVSGHSLMLVIGAVEMLVGLAILSRWTRIAAYAAAAWLACIALNLLSTGGFFDLAVRDLVMAVAACALANLTAARESLRSALPRNQLTAAAPRAAATA